MSGNILYLKDIKRTDASRRPKDGPNSCFVHVRLAEELDRAQWDSYVFTHPHSGLYHLFGWRDVIAKTYKHKSYYLIAERKPLRPVPSDTIRSGEQPHNSTAGVLPLIHMRSRIFGSKLISMPFMDFGGILAEDGETEAKLLQSAIDLSRELKANTLELRHLQPLSPKALAKPLEMETSVGFSTRVDKVRMLLELPESPEVLMASFKSKLRNKVKKTLSEGMHCRVGGTELLRDFYHIFSINMRDLGSPVHSRKLMLHTLNQFPAESRIFVAYIGRQPVACSMAIGFRDVLENPWASSLRRYGRLRPNMFLYWKMLEYGSQNGYSLFDFGRSSPNEGTFEFKNQWGAQANELHWHYVFLDGRRGMESQSEKARFARFINIWKRLPVNVSRLIGPFIRKQIGL